MRHNLITYQPRGKIVFVGDTHGDFEASQKVIDNYLRPGYTIVWLGDYVDRGNHSQENINLLLEARRNHPEQVYLLLGNHETFIKNSFYPAEFWYNINHVDKEYYSRVFDTLPLVFSSGTIISLHGILPDVPSLEHISEINDGNNDWQRIVWGDFVEQNIEEPPWFDRMRPCFGTPYFNRIMSRLNKKLLIKSHQPNAPERMFSNRCLTIFTSNAYPRKRTIAIADMAKPNETLDDLEILEI